MNVTVTVRVTSSERVTPLSVKELCLWLAPVTFTSRRRSARAGGIFRNSSPLRLPPARLGGLLKLLPKGLIRGSAQKIIDDAWNLIEAKLKSA